MAQWSRLVLAVQAVTALVSVAGAAIAQVTESPVAAQASTPELRTRVLSALGSLSWYESIGALRQSHGDLAVLDELLDMLEHADELGRPVPRAAAFDALLDLTGDISPDTGRQTRIAALLLVGLSDASTRSVAILGVMHVAPDEQRRLVPPLIALLDDPNREQQRDICRVLGRLGPVAGVALPRLRELLVTPEAPGSASARKAGPDQVRRAAAEARLEISGDPTVDVALYPTLDADGQAAVDGPVAMLLGHVGVPRGHDDAPRRELADYYLGRLGTLDFADRDAMRVGLALPRLLSDETDSAIRERTRALLARLAEAGDGPAAEFARVCLDPPEARFAHDEELPADARVERVFRPRSSLLTVAQTERGLLAVSAATRGVQPGTYPPEVSMLFVWDVEQGTLLHCIDGVRGDALAAELAPDGAHLVVGTRGGYAARPADGLVLCALDGESEPMVVPGNEAGVGRFVLLAGAQRVASIGIDGPVRLADLAAGTVRELWVPPEQAVATALAARADGRRLVVGASDLSLRLYDTGSAACLATGSMRDPSLPEPAEGSGRATGHPWLPGEAAFLPDGERVLIGDMSGRLLVWDPRSTDPPVHFADAAVPVASIALSPDGTRVVTGLTGTWKDRRLQHPDDFSVKVWDASTGAAVTRLTGMWSPAGVVAFLGESRVLGLNAEALRVWKLDEN